jgi:hypothetical protein
LASDLPKYTLGARIEKAARHKTPRLENEPPRHRGAARFTELGNKLEHTEQWGYDKLTAAFRRWAQTILHNC